MRQVAWINRDLCSGGPPLHVVRLLRKLGEIRGESGRLVPFLISRLPLLILEGRRGWRRGTAEVG
jgi:hypothetical protein